jgi:hypothetical protein
MEHRNFRLFTQARRIFLTRNLNLRASQVLLKLRLNLLKGAIDLVVLGNDLTAHACNRRTFPHRFFRLCITQDGN